LSCAKSDRLDSARSGRSAEDEAGYSNDSSTQVAVRCAFVLDESIWAIEAIRLINPCTFEWRL